MTHKALTNECEALALKVEQQPDPGGAKSYSATAPGQRVTWRVSHTGGLLGLPRVIVNGRDTHARSLHEVRYLLKP